jgi:Mn-dependent DtxR family transcriptional regulator
MAEGATKRIPVTEPIWESLAELKKHGQTYDQLLAELIALKQEHDFLAHIEELEKHGAYVSLKDAAKDLNIPEPVSEGANPPRRNQDFLAQLEELEKQVDGIDLNEIAKDLNIPKSGNEEIQQ